MKRIAIVTGASRGIGREIAKMLAKEDIQVIANYNNSEKTRVIYGIMKYIENIIE